jgi:penicillin-binding protein 1C
MGFFLFDQLKPLDLSSIKDTSKVITFNNNTIMYATTNKTSKWRFDVDLEKIDPQYLQLLIAYEDRRFYSHYGIDPLAMFRAVGQLLSQGHVISGGSTITMQLARLLQPRPRTISSKLIEMIHALQLELHYSKKEILSAYLTLAPYGGNVEGVVAASMRYFDKPPYSLSASQMALLVALPQSPERHRPDKHYKKSIQVRDKILAYAKEKHLISPYLYIEAKKESLPKKLHPFPRYAPHLAHKILQKTLLAQHTSLNAKLQQQLEHWAQSKTSFLGKDTTMAMLVIRNTDASMQAYLGSHHIFSSQVSGYIDMVNAIRSPGSTLKPFIYAYGFEKHLIHPNTIILDQETHFGNYHPHNFSHSYQGEVTLKYALQHSLNIPAVKVLNKVGVDAFVERLTQSTGALHIPKQRASLPIALGGLGISLWQLSQLYVSLANAKETQKLHYLKQTKQTVSKTQLFTPQASQMTNAILRELPAPIGFTNPHQQIAYKTGTSYGYRDAWTIAYTKAYTIAVWVGKPDNSMQFKRTGSNTASPLAFEAFSILHSLVTPQAWTWSPSYLGSTVPLGLQYFDLEEKEEVATLHFVSPQNNERFMSADCSDAIIEIQIKAGKAPYYWYIDGEEKTFNKTSFSLPFTHGGHTLHVIDSTGATQTRDIWVNKPEC